MRRSARRAAACDRIRTETRPFLHVFAAARAYRLVALAIAVIAPNPKGEIMNASRRRTLIMGAWMLAAEAIAQEQFAYPPEGRTPEQQRQDAFECHQWAVGQSGFDPAADTPAPPTSAQAASTQSPANAQGQTSSTSRGPRPAVGGAVRGAAIGEVAGGDAGDGAAAGAALGVVRQRLAQRGAAAEAASAQAEAQKRAQAQQAADAETAHSKRQAYRSARGTCLKARGYTVSGA
jgi:hypothetical protein